jgi:hypothetical protein
VKSGKFLGHLIEVFLPKDWLTARLQLLSPTAIVLCLNASRPSAKTPQPLAYARTHARTHAHIVLKFITHIFHISATRFVCVNGLTTNKHQPLYDSAFCLFVCWELLRWLGGSLDGCMVDWFASFFRSLVDWLHG